MSQRSRRGRAVWYPQRAHPTRNLLGWELHWTPLPIETDSPDVAGWSHNYTGQEVVVTRGRDTYTVEARHGDVVNEIQDKKGLKKALAFAEGFMEGQPEGQVL